LVFLLILTALFKPFGFLADFDYQKQKALNKVFKFSKKTKGLKQGIQIQKENQRP
jgi:hypothetical protein